MISQTNNEISMDIETYKIIKRAHKNEINETELKKIKLNTPIMKSRVKLILGEIDMNVNFSNMRKKFLKIENDLKYKDELVITYLLFLGKILNNSFLMHMFLAPQSQIIFNWISLYKKLVYSIVVLLYNKQFSDEDWINLDDMVNNLNEGYSNSVRNYLNKMKILTISKDDLLDIEIKYDEIFTLTADDFGPFYWQMLHFMAEAINLRKNADLAKRIWKEFVVLLLDRTLICSICRNHYRESVIPKFKNELQNSSDYSALWFNIHNHVNKTLNKLEYPKSEFDKDLKTIRDLLSHKK